MPTVYNKVVADNTTLIDLSQDTVTQASHIVSGYVGHLADGTQVTGTGGGGGPTPVPEKDVNFIDYDGTILYSYTAQEAAALSAMPANPSHTGLTAQGWNYTLAQMKTQVTALGACDIGQMYTTSDGKTRLYIEIPAGTTGAGLTFYVRYTQTVSKGVTVDWGDGNSETFTGTSAANRSHTYTAPGNYVITLNVTSGTVSFVGSSSYAIYGASGNYYNRTRIKKAEFGSNVTSIGNYAFDCCYTLESVTIPSGVTSIGDYAFDSCYILESVTIPSGVTSIGNYAFQYCYALESVTIPSGVTSIGNYAFQACYALGEIHFKPSSPPTVSNSNAWTSIPTYCRIYVPTGKLSAYTSASNYPSSATYTYVEE